MKQNQKVKNQKYELKYRKTRIDRHNTPVNRFLDDAREKGKTPTRAIQELLDREAQLEAQLRQSELDKIDEVQKVCSVLFKNMLPDYRAGQLDLWMSAFKRRFVARDAEYDLQRVFEVIEEAERDNAYILLKNAKPVIER